MPRGYLKMKERFKNEGMSEKAAAKKAAKIWNSKHPEDPVYPARERKRK